MVPGKGVWYMVVIGKYANSTEADAMLNRLRQENVDASLVKQ
jgi:cell division protein FtsN